MYYTEAQLKAIKTINVPLMVLATAGSGKTMVLIERVKTLIKDYKIKPDEILAITFTNKATNDMRRKLDNGLVVVKTIHSMCCDILREDIQQLNLNYTKEFSIIDTSDSIDIIKSVMNSNGITSNLGYNHILELISNYINLGQELTEQVKLVSDLYFEYLERFNLMTFDNMLFFVKKLLTENVFIQLKYESIYKHILVDEFQDVNRIQYEIIKLLVGYNKNIFVVGDDDQSIYGFRGSYTNIFFDFRNDYKPTEIYLEKNFRSNDKLCKFANRLINRNKNRVKKNIYNTYSVNYNPLILKSFTTSEKEIEFIVNDIKDNLPNISRKYNEVPIAILYRNNFVARDFEKKLLEANIKYNIFGGIPFIRLKEIADIISYFKLIYDNNSFIDFKRICNVPTRGIGNTSVNKIYRELINADLDLNSIILNSDKILTKRSYINLIEFWKSITAVSINLEDLSYYEIYTKILTDYKYFEIIKDDIDKNTNVLWLGNLLKDLDREYILSGMELTKKEYFMKFINDSNFNDGSSSISDVDVVLSTIHSSKGLEFDYVYLVNFEDEFTPLIYNKSYDQDYIEEERRVAFVGITRARKKITISYVSSRFYFGKYVRCNESRFIEEAMF